MDVKEILQKCTVQGNVIKPPAGTLDFKVYKALKLHLEQLGGHWNGGKIQGFVFENNPSHLVNKLEEVSQQTSMFSPPPPIIHAPEVENEPEVEGIMPIIEKFIPEPIYQSPINNNEMNFFQQLLAVGNVDMTMRIMEKNGKLTIMIMPGSGSATIPPINITGTPAELDDKFFSVIAPGVNAITGMVSNIEEVKKEVAAASSTPAAHTESSKSKEPVAKAKAKAKAKSKGKEKVKPAPAAAEPDEVTEQEPATAE